jgi:CheY-like chemotaxis protein
VQYDVRRFARELPAMADRTKPKIAVLEDHEDTRELLRLFLESDFAVQDFTDAPSLLRTLEQETFDLIVADIMLPELNGYDLIRTLKSDWRFERIPVIALTALAMALDREKLERAGFSQYLIKPIEPRDVRDAIWRCLAACGHRTSPAD